MNRLHFALFLTAILMISACAEQKSIPMESRQRGSEDFRNSLRLGAGSNRPATPQAGSRLSLTGKDQGIASIALDSAADIWNWVSFDTRRQNLISADQSLVEWSRTYISQHKTELGIDSSELSTFSNTLAEPYENHIFVTFERIYQGREVRSAFVQLVFSREKEGYRLREIINNSFGAISLKNEAPAAVSAQVVVDATDIPTLHASQPKSLIYPLLGTDGRYDFRFATEWVLEDPNDDEVFHVIIDDDSQNILSAVSNHFHVKQTLSMETYKNSYVTKQIAVVPFAGAKLDTLVVDSLGVVDTAATQGVLSLSSVRGSVVSLLGNQNNTAAYTLPVTFAANGKTTVTLASGADPAALNAFAALNEVNTWAGRFLTPQQASLMSTGILTRVNLIGPKDGEYCNAFFNGDSLNFFAQGTVGNVTCANTALIKDVMYHEWGHALDAVVGIRRGITDGAFSEGIGDINATLATGNPVLGQGFFLNNANSMVRSVDNTRVYPPANAAEEAVHSQGQIIGGAFWDLRQSLVALYGVEEGTTRVGSFFFKHLLVTDRYLDSYASVLRLDDNDNNPATKSPSYCAINKAFAKHKLIGAAVVEGDACVDQDQGLKVRVDTDNGNGSLNLIASAYGATSIAFCSGKVTNCAAGAGTIEFKKPINPAIPVPLTLAGPKSFYQAAGTVVVKAGEMYSLISRDATGKTLGVKTMSFGARDQSTDLSKTFKVQ